MTQVDFYILEDERPGSRERLLCRLAGKAWKNGHRIHIHTASPEQSRQIDDLLWSHHDGSFLPHDLYRSDLDNPAPILIHHEFEPAYHADVLINLAPEVPLFFSRFERVAELINHEPVVRNQGRARFRFYKDRGYPLKSHKIAAARMA